MEIDKILNLELTEFLDALRPLSYEKRLNLLQDERICEKVFLLDKKQNAWDFRKVLEVYDANALLNKMKNPIISKIKKMYKGHEYVYLVCLKRSDQISFEKELLKNDNLLFLLLYNGESFYSELDFSYDTLIAIINFVSLNKIPINDTCLSSIILLSLKNKPDKWENFLKQDIDNTYKKMTFSYISPDLVNNYIKSHVISFTNKEIYNLILYSEVELDRNLYENKDFFREIIFSSSIFQMREKIARLSNHIDTTYFENLISKMEDEILDEYIKNKTFIRNYDQTLEKEFLELQFISKKDEVFPDKKIILIIVIDKLFQDSIRNVFLNIEELLSFNDNNFDKEKLDFYREVMTLYEKTPNEILEFYNRYKDSYQVSTYYDDVRNCKDLSYQKIKDKCFKPMDNENLKNQELSKKLKVDIYELNGEDFIMLVTCRARIPSGNNLAARNCYSLIGSKNMHVFNEDNYIYGFTNFEINKIMHVLEDDSYSLDQPINTTSFINRIRSIDDILSSNKMNEIQIKNLKISGSNEFDFRYERILPSYIVCFDTIREKDLNAARILNIPIIKINRSKYQEGKTVVLENYNEKYTTSFYDETIYQDKFL